MSKFVDDWLKEREVVSKNAPPPITLPVLDMLCANGERHDWEVVEERKDIVVGRSYTDKSNIWAYYVDIYGSSSYSTSNYKYFNPKNKICLKCGKKHNEISPALKLIALAESKQFMKDFELRFKSELMQERKKLAIKMWNEGE